MPAVQKIREIEEGVLPAETRVLEDPDRVRQRVVEIHATSDELMVCSTGGALQLVHDQFLDLYRDIGARRAAGRHKGVMWAMNITRVDIPLVKKFLELGLMEIRHVNSQPSMYYAVSDKIFNATVEKMEGAG